MLTFWLVVVGLRFSIVKVTLISNIPEDYVADEFFIKAKKDLIHKRLWSVVMAADGIFGTTSGNFILCLLLLYIALLFVFLITGLNFLQNKQDQENQELDNFKKEKKEK